MRSPQAHLGSAAERGKVDPVRTDGESNFGTLRAHRAAQGASEADTCRWQTRRRRGESERALDGGLQGGVVRTSDLKRCEPLTVRDQHSRFVLAVHVCRSPQFEDALQLFET